MHMSETLLALWASHTAAAASGGALRCRSPSRGCRAAGRRTKALNRGGFMLLGLAGCTCNEALHRGSCRVGLVGLDVAALL